jgi:hypothetical protein
MTVVVLHTAESDPGTCEAVARYLVRMGYESHEVFDPSNGDGVILLPASTPAKSLVNLLGGVETNKRGGVYQIEIIARAVDVPHYDDAWYARLKQRLIEICAFTGTPYVFPLPFEPYPQSYGRNLVRMTYDEWLCCEGVVGHQHVPENDHGDPGALDVERLIDLTPAAQPEPEPDMILLRVTDDPSFPVVGDHGGVVLELSGNGIAWVRSANVPPIYAQGGVKTVDTTKAVVDEMLLTKSGVGPPPSDVGSVVTW